MLLEGSSTICIDQSLKRCRDDVDVELIISEILVEFFKIRPSRFVPCRTSHLNQTCIESRLLEHHTRLTANFAFFLKRSQTKQTMSGNPEVEEVCSNPNLTAWGS